VSLYRHSVVTLRLDRFVLETSLVLYRNCHFCTYAGVLRTKFGHVPIGEQCGAVSHAPGLIILVVMLFSENVNLFNHSART